jgi:hypothetical protein
MQQLWSNVGLLRHVIYDTEELMNKVTYISSNIVPERIDFMSHNADVWYLDSMHLKQNFYILCKINK